MYKLYIVSEETGELILHAECRDVDLLRNSYSFIDLEYRRYDWTVPMVIIEDENGNTMDRFDRDAHLASVPGLSTSVVKKLEAMYITYFSHLKSTPLTDLEANSFTKAEIRDIIDFIRKQY
jgi:hypothetical protein